jgi:amino acid adenylation domain-containing protein
MSEPVSSAERSARVQSLLRKRREVRSATVEEEGAIPRRPAAGPAPLSFAQERLWFLDRLDPGSPTYNIPAALRLRGPLDPAILAACLDEVVRRHEALRTTFALPEGIGDGGDGGDGPVQIVAPALRRLVPRIDLRLAREEARRLAAAEARFPFDLARGPLMRVALLELGDEEHVLLLTLHHAIADGWSIRILISELTQLYEAFSASLPSPLPELPIQYGDFAVWQREHLQGAVLAGQIAWWRGALASAPVVLDLPLDHPRGPVPSSRGGGHPFALSIEIQERLYAVVREQGVTLFMTLLLAFQALLGRCSNQEDLLVGTPVANRTRVETEGLIGLFANTLVLRGDLSGGPTFRQALARVREACLGAFAHQDLPFERLVAELNPERDLGRSPLFQALFVLQNLGAAPRSERLVVEPLEVPLGVAKFDLALALFESGRGMFGNLEYRRDLFEPATIARFAAQLKALLAGALADPDAPLPDLPLLGPAERHQLVREWNDTATDHGEGGCLHELIAQQAARTPDAPALVFEGESLTYAEVDRRSNHLAWRLRELGVGPEVRVAVEVERSLELPLALLGVLKAGGAYVPLDPSYPQERLDYMLADSRAAVRLTREQMLPGESGEAPNSGAQPDNLAYVIYTSGSTGRPKGAMNSHRGIVNRLRWMQSAYGLDASDRVLQKTPASFDVSVWEFFWPLLTGACLVVARPGGHQDGAYLVDLIRREKVTTLHFVPSMLQVFVEQPGVEQCTSLRRVICSGEALPADLVRRFFEKLGSELHNLYGPTEAAVDVTFQACRREDRVVPIGRPIDNLAIRIVDRAFRPAPLGVPGELLIGGVGVGRGYLDRPDLTAERFVPGEGERLYRTGDLARFLGDGRIEYLGRIDHQVKVRGFRIELQEIEAVLASHPAVREALVIPWEQALAAYVVPRGKIDPADLREALRRSLPEFMVPASFTLLPAFPLNPSGKLDRRALPKPERSKAGGVRPRSETERALAAIWGEVLGLPEVPVTESFFDLGGHSLLLARVERKIHEELGREVPLLELFRHPTVETLAVFLTGSLSGSQPAARAAAPAPAAAGSAVAIVGMAGRFPGAGSVEELWQRLCRGDELVTFFSDEELLAEGVPRERLADPRYVRARGVLDGADRFAASFFEVSPREAEIMDPQQRVFLECAWEALEDAAIDPSRFPGRVAVFAGASENGYVRNLQANPGAVRAVGGYQAFLLNRNDFLPARVSYKLDLRGPSLNVQTACSTALVAVHLACRSLLEGECEAALAGGVSIAGVRRGYLYEAGGIASPDGHTRTFSSRARGTIAGEGVGIVVLKRLADALESGDRIYAVLRATALNNDGGQKIGFTAPSIDGQAAVIAAAQAAAGVDPDTLGYVEAHGTATELGDPIEMAALTQAFRAKTSRSGYCAIGSIKSNLGHLDAAAGVAGLIKAALAVERGEIPPSLHFDEPNPRIDFASSPFYVQTALTPWPDGTSPRRAAVSSFGIGGTNAHAILEQAPPAPGTGPSRRWHLLPFSAKTPAALNAMCARLADHLERHPGLDLADVAWTLQVGREAFAHRRIVVAGSREEAVARLRESGITGVAGRPDRPVFFLFPGQGSQHAGMAMELYREEPVFREHFDRCLGPEILPALETGEGLLDTSIAQPALFAVEYSLARLWMSWGIEPAGFLGHSIGEYVAACLAGVFTLEQAVSIVAARGRLMQQLPEGAMLAFSGPEEVAISHGLDIAAVNAPGALVVSGPVAAIEGLERELPESRRLYTRRAFHSAMTEPVLEPFARQVGEHALQAPRIPFVSNLSGTWITAAEATDPGYWARHLRGAVRFGDGVRTLLDEPDAVLLEVGPRRTLAALARRQAEGVPGSTVLSSLAIPGEPAGDQQTLLSALGRLWLSGIEVDWTALNAPGRRRRVPLPTYPFERGSYWLAAAEAVSPRIAAPEPPAVFASPGSEMERRLGAIWRDLLGVARIEPHDNFFELGGSSLLAVRLGSHLRRELGIEVAPHLLLAHPTLGSFASAVTELRPEPSGCLVAVQPRGGRPPLFLVHPAGGHVYLFRELSEELGEDQPLYGLRALGLQPGETPAASVEEMAERYLAEIRAFRPAGPYLLGGSSMGGMIAWEMAQRLAAAGEEVPLLALFDTFGPGQLPEQAEDGGPPGDAEPEERQRLRAVIRANVGAMHAYEPRPYPGKVVFFRADDRGSDPPHPERPWIELARGGTEIYPVPGDHVSLHARPHVATVALRLAHCLEGI